MRSVRKIKSPREYCPYKINGIVIGLVTHCKAIAIMQFALAGMLIKKATSI